MTKAKNVSGLFLLNIKESRVHSLKPLSKETFPKVNVYFIILKIEFVGSQRVRNSSIFEPYRFISSRKLFFLSIPNWKYLEKGFRKEGWLKSTKHDSEGKVKYFNLICDQTTSHVFCIHSPISGKNLTIAVRIMGVDILPVRHVTLKFF